MDNKSRIQKEIVDGLDNPSHGILLLAPRVGKTKIAIDIIKKEEPSNILWVTPSEKLRDIDIPDEFNNWKAKSYLNKTTIVCWSSLKNIKGHFTKVILDEYQEITENNSEVFFSGKITCNSILCLSGTHPRHQEKQDILDRLELGLLKDLSIEEAIQENLISDYKIKVITATLDRSRKDVVGGNKKNPFLTTEKQMYDYLSTLISKLMYLKKPTKFIVLRRMRLIYESKTKELIAKYLIDNLKGRKLIFAGSIEQSKRLSQYTFNSKTNNKDLDKFMNQEIDTLACVRSGGIGFTYKNIDNLIIVQSDSDKKGETTQKFCRTLLLQQDYKANIWFICLTDSQDKTWVSSTLESLDEGKIEYIEFENLKL